MAIEQQANESFYKAIEAMCKKYTYEEVTDLARRDGIAGFFGMFDVMNEEMSIEEYRAKCLWLPTIYTGVCYPEDITAYYKRMRGEG